MEHTELEHWAGGLFEECQSGWWAMWEAAVGPLEWRALHAK